MYTYDWMHKNTEELYNQIKDLKTKKEFEDEISRIKKENDELLDENTIALMIVDKLGRNKQNILKIADLKQGMECTVYGKITNIGETRIFNRKNGSNGKVVNLEISDETGSCNLALWHKDVELIQNKSIKIGSNVKIINGYVKDGYNGIELNVGQWGVIEIEPENMPTIRNEKTNNNGTIIKGTLVEMDTTRPFFKDNGEYGFVTNIKIRNSDGIKQLTVWDEKVKEIQQYKTGIQLEIKNIDIRMKNKSTEIHVNGRSTIKKL